MKQTISMDEIRAETTEVDTEAVDAAGPPLEVKKKWMIFRIFTGSLAVFCGFLVMITFIYPWAFWNTVAFSGLSGVVGCFLLYVHVQWYRRYWHRQKNAYATLSAFMLTGCFSQLLGICGMCVYITLAVMLKQDLNLVYGVDNYWMATTWSFMTLKWGSAVFWYSRSYRRLIKRLDDNKTLTQ